ncbi:dihydrolipoyl dehydrogenase family protein [Citrifermentans bremense]|uniref:dihydrolipoyl dehydrogenase family protein n=1 Tax=Citrifermentans bremense TaxID=60035 RepID=UPI00041ED819|nr:NAD(P)/FAD-dependent oxidoreductase [Citrifermentans bremense]
MQETADVLVIGTGTAGFTLALACRKGGRQVAVVDDKPYGGTCGRNGCEPEKYLMQAAQVVHLTRQMSGQGITVPAAMDWPALIRSKSAFSNGVPERTELAFQQAGIKMYFGTARFLSPETVAIGSETTVRAETIVIATGARPAPLDFPGAGLVVETSDFMEMKNLPRRVLFIGGGCLALSFGHVARAAGADVTILQRGERVLKNFDLEMAQLAAKAARARGINIVTGITAAMAEKVQGAFMTYGKGGCTEAFPSDLIVNTSGRIPDLDPVDPEAGAVARSAGGVTVNEFLQSVSNPRVWAIGDACDSPYLLSTVADMEAEVAADNILNGNRRRPDYQGVPSMAQAQPPLSFVGLTEAQARQSGKKFRINRGSTDSWPSSRRIGQQGGFYKVLIEEETGKILGAHLLGQNAGETINIFALALKFGISNRELRQVLWTYPTFISDVKDMIE